MSLPAAHIAAMACAPVKAQVPVVWQLRRVCERTKLQALAEMTFPGSKRTCTLTPILHPGGTP
jgi:hypothetical protein